MAAAVAQQQQQQQQSHQQHQQQSKLSQQSQSQSQMPSAADISLMLSLGLGLDANQLANLDLQKLAIYLVSILNNNSKNLQSKPLLKKKDRFFILFSCGCGNFFFFGSVH